MNKTIRSNCFETNSSSTHSVTIINKSQLRTKAKEEKLPLVKDNVLYPAHLKFSDNYTQAGEASILNAITTDEKAALFIQHWAGAEAWDYDNDKEIVKPSFEVVKNFLKKMIGYADVIIPEEGSGYWTYFTSDNEDGEDYITEILTSEDIEMAILDHIEDVIMNDEIVIKETDSPY